MPANVLLSRYSGGTPSETTEIHCSIRDEGRFATITFEVAAPMRDHERVDALAQDYLEMVRTTLNDKAAGR